MKSLPFLFVFLISSAACFGQLVLERSFENAQKLSRQTGKPIALMIKSEYSNSELSGIVGLNNRLVIKKLNGGFINYRADRFEQPAQIYIEKYKLTGLPWLIAIDSKGAVLRKLVISTDPEVMGAALDAILADSKQTSLIDMDELYQEGDSSSAFLELYLTRRITADIFTNQELVERYARSLLDTELDYASALLILKGGPVVDGMAFRRVAANNQLLDSIVKTENEYVIGGIASRITNNTLNSAIENRNHNRALAAAEFARLSSPTNGAKRHSSILLDYYKKIGDTANFLSKAMTHYEDHYMKSGPDPLEKAIKSMPNAVVIKSSVGSSSARDLHEGANSVYETGTNNPVYLYNAIQWTERAIRLFEDAKYYKTLGLLYHRMGINRDAETAMGQAIKLSKKGGLSTDELEEHLAKIRNSSL